MVPHADLAQPWPKTLQRIRNFIGFSVIPFTTGTNGTEVPAGTCTPGGVIPANECELPFNGGL